MSATVPIAIRTGQSISRSARVAFAALAVVILLALAFVVGRTTASTTTKTTIVPATATHSSVADCHAGRPC